MFNWFLTGANKPRIQDPALVKKMFHSARVQAVTAMILGYGMYYVMRMTMGVAKKPMIEAGFTPTRLGAIGAGMLVAIAVGKCANGFIADHCNIKKIVPLGLLGAAIVNAILGFTDSYWVFLVLWFINGCFQSMGSGSLHRVPFPVVFQEPAGNLLRCFQYSTLCRGRRYLFRNSDDHHGLWLACGLLCSGHCLHRTGLHHVPLRGTVPETYGLPTANEFEGEAVQEKKEQQISTKEAQLMVIRNPYVWLLASCGYLPGNFPLFHRKRLGRSIPAGIKGFDLVTAGGLMSLSPILSGVGSFFSGIISDKVFKSHHSVTTIVFGIVMLIGIAGICLVPADSPTLTALCIAVFGFGLGVILCFVGGMLAVDLCPRKATGAAMGVIGLLAYGGAALQDIVNGILLDSARWS